MPRVRKVNLEFNCHADGVLDEVQFTLRAMDGKPLTAQQIIDSIAEYLLYSKFFEETYDEGSKTKLDS